MPIRFYYTGKAKETSSHPQSSFMFHFHLLTLKIQKFTICSLDFYYFWVHNRLAVKYLTAGFLSSI